MENYNENVLKLRVREQKLKEELEYWETEFKPSGNNGQYTTISFATTCQQTNDHLITEINAMLCKIMHERIDAKYAPKVWEPEMVEYDYEGFINSTL
jgi:hypothetical protein